MLVSSARAIRERSWLKVKILLYYLQQGDCLIEVSWCVIWTFWIPWPYRGLLGSCCVFPSVGETDLNGNCRLLCIEIKIEAFFLCLRYSTDVAHRGPLGGG